MSGNGIKEAVSGLALKQPLPTVRNSAAQLTAADLAGGIILSAPTANINLTLPSGALMDTAQVVLKVDDAFDWCVVNNSGTFTIQILFNGVGTHSVVGHPIIAASSSAMFRTRRTSSFNGANYVTYRIA